MTSRREGTHAVSDGCSLSCWALALLPHAQGQPGFVSGLKITSLGTLEEQEVISVPALLEHPSPVSCGPGEVAPAADFTPRLCSGHPQLLSLLGPSRGSSEVPPQSCDRGHHPDRAPCAVPSTGASPGWFLPVPLAKGGSRGWESQPPLCSICAPRIVCSLLLAAGSCRRCLPSLPLPHYSPGHADLDSRWTGTTFLPRSFGGR